MFFYPQDALVYTQGLRPTNLKPKVYQTKDINFWQPFATKSRAIQLFINTFTHAYILTRFVHKETKPIIKKIVYKYIISDVIKNKVIMVKKPTGCPWEGISTCFFVDGTVVL